MEWCDKIEMVKLFNQGKQKEATEFYIEKENWKNWNDIQALSMYANAMNLEHPEELIGLKDKLKEIQMFYGERYGCLGFRESLRLATLQDLWSMKK